MNISKNLEGSKTTLILEGWLDTAAAPELHAAVGELEATDELVFDFTGVEYMASSGLREVVAAFKMQTEAGKTFSVIGVNAEVMDVFQLTGVTSKINIVAKDA